MNPKDRALLITRHVVLVALAGTALFTGIVDREHRKEREEANAEIKELQEQLKLRGCQLWSDKGYRLILQDTMAKNRTLNTQLLLDEKVIHDLEERLRFYEAAQKSGPGGLAAQGSENNDSYTGAPGRSNLELGIMQVEKGTPGGNRID
jgi:hypothetical protein